MARTSTAAGASRRAGAAEVAGASVATGVGAGTGVSTGKGSAMAGIVGSERAVMAAAMAVQTALCLLKRLSFFLPGARNSWATERSCG
ncbi:hypothetical protein D3C86_1956160 [compost metagenome]